MSTLNEQEKNMRALVSASKTVASEEGITDDDLLISRTNDIYNDAVKAVPTTPAGTAARNMAIKILRANELAEGNGLDPYAASGYDYEQYFDERIPSAIRGILDSLPEFSAGLTVPSQSKQLSEEQFDAFEDVKEQASLAWFRILNANSVPMTKYDNLFKELRDIITAVESVINDQINGHSRELLSRSYRAVNPGTGLLDVNFATYHDLLEARKTIKNAQDESDGEDRYSFRKKDSMREGE